MTVATNDTADRGKRKRVPRAERERQMIEAAEAVFTTRGYAATSMDEIAERVGVSKPMLYEYFRSKEGLLLACIQQFRTELHAATAHAVAEAASPEETLREGLHAFFAFIDAHRAAWALLRQEMAVVGTWATTEIEATRRQQTELVAALLTSYLDDNAELRAQAYAEFVIGACERLAIWAEQHDQVTPEVATEYAMDVLWGGLIRQAIDAKTH